MTAELTQLIRESLPALSAIGGAIVGVAGGILTSMIAQRSEERKHLRSLAFTAGVENFKASIEVAKGHSGNVKLMPLDTYILNMRYLCDVLDKGNMIPDELVAALEKNCQLMNAVTELVQKKSAEPAA